MPTRYPAYPKSASARFGNSRGWRRRFGSMTLAGVLWMTGGWVLQDAIAPAIVQAYVARVDVTLDVFPGETYDTLIRRAETVARAAAQRSFDRDILITEVAVIILGRNRGSSVQILSLQTSRTQWRSRPDPRRWATYYPNAKRLLGMGGGALGSPIANPTVTSAPPPSTQAAPPPAVPINPATTTPQSASPPSSPTPKPTPTPSAFPSVPPQAQPASPPPPGTTPLPPLRRLL